MDPDIRIWTLAERPDLEDRMWAIGDQGMPEFMLHDVAAGLYFDHLVSDYAEYVVLACRSDDPETVLARGLSVPFAMGFGRRTELPERGWDQVIAWAHADLADGRAPTHVSALEINVLDEYRGQAVSPIVLAGMKANAARAADVDELVAPLRPNRKHLEAGTAMGEYVVRLRPDGLPVDPWLRVHVRAGGEIVRVCPTSMTVTGTLAQWREWTGLPFDADGDVEVPGALSPVIVRVDRDFAVYVEPNVWIRHRTR